MHSLLHPFLSSPGQHISPNKGFFMWGWGIYLLLSYSREQGQTTPRLTYSAWGRAEASANNKGKQEKGKTGAEVKCAVRAN